MLGSKGFVVNLFFSIKIFYQYSNFFILNLMQNF